MLVAREGERADPPRRGPAGRSAATSTSPGSRSRPRGRPHGPRRGRRLPGVGHRRGRRGAHRTRRLALPDATRRVAGRRSRPSSRRRRPRSWRPRRIAPSAGRSGGSPAPRRPRPGPRPRRGRRWTRPARPRPSSTRNGQRRRRCARRWPSPGPSSTRCAPSRSATIARLKEAEAALASAHGGDCGPLATSCGWPRPS